MFSLPCISSKTSILLRHTCVSLSMSMTIMSSTRLPSGLDENFRKDFIIIEDFLLLFLVLNTWPSISSISCSSKAWSPVSIGTTEISRTARNWPQLFRCSFSRRKKFQMKRLQPKKKDNLTTTKTKCMLYYSIVQGKQVVLDKTTRKRRRYSSTRFRGIRSKAHSKLNSNTLSRRVRSNLTLNMNKYSCL